MECYFYANVMLDPVGLLLLPEYPQDIPSKLLRRMLRSGIWQKHQRGRLSLEAAASLLAELPFVTGRWTAGEIAGVLQNRALKPASWMLQLLDLLREQLHLRLFCVCNASPEELLALRAQFSALFAKFDATYTSGEEGFVRPSVRFFKIALNKACVQAHETFYLDSHDSFESFAAARSLGMHALLLQPALMGKLNTVSFSFDMLVKHILVRFSSTPTSGLLRSLVHCPILLQGVPMILTPTAPSNSEVPKIKEAAPPISDGVFMNTCSQATLPLILTLGTASEQRSKALALAWKYLIETDAHDLKRSFDHPTLTSDGVRILDNYTQFLIADVLDDHRFLPMQRPPLHGLICFMDRSSYLRDNDTGRSANTNMNGHYYASDMCALEDIPDDLDATSIGLSVLYKFGKVDLDTINRVLDMMLDHRSKDDGILEVYFDAERPRIDPVVVANALYLFHLANRGHEAERSEMFLESVLLHRAYEEGTLYYNLPETFLWCVARLVHRFKEHFDKRRPGMRELLAFRLNEGPASVKLQEEEEKIGALALAMRMRACSLCGLDGDTRSREELVQLQRGNGSWHCEPFYHYGSNAQSWFRNEGLSTAFAVAALVTRCSP